MNSAIQKSNDVFFYMFITLTALEQNLGEASKESPPLTIDIEPINPRSRRRQATPRKTPENSEAS